MHFYIFNLFQLQFILSVKGPLYEAQQHFLFSREVWRWLLAEIKLQVTTKWNAAPVVSPLRCVQVHWWNGERITIYCDFDFNEPLLMNCERNSKRFFLFFFFSLSFLLGCSRPWVEQQPQPDFRWKINTAKNWKIRFNPLFSPFCVKLCVIYNDLLENSIPSLLAWWIKIANRVQPYFSSLLLPEMF